MLQATYKFSISIVFLAVTSFCFISCSNGKPAVQNNNAKNEMKTEQQLADQEVKFKKAIYEQLGLDKEQIIAAEKISADFDLKMKAAKGDKALSKKYFDERVAAFDNILTAEQKAKFKKMQAGGAR